MEDVISAYQKWKQQGQTLRTQAKDAMEVRFRDLLSEAMQVAQEYQRDFGSVLKPPVPITAFRYKAGGKAKKKSSGPAKQLPAAAPDAKSSALQKRLEQARKKLDAAKATSKPTKNLEDKIYEIEDELRLSGHKV